MRVLIVEDHPLMLSGVRDVVIEVWPQAICEGVADAAAVLRALSRENDYTFVCVDLRLPDLDGIELIRQLCARRPSLPVAVLSANEHPLSVQQAIDAGAQGYLFKSLSRDEMLDALRQFTTVGHYLPPALRAVLTRHYPARTSKRGVLRLTRRQRDVLKLVANGLGNQAIATRLGLTESTVKGHVSSLLDLLDAENRTACVQHARELGLLND